MTTETMPAGISVSFFEWEQILNDEDFRDANGGMWSAGRNGNRWGLVLTFRNKIEDELFDLMGVVTQMRGKRNRLRIGPGDFGWARRGTGGGGSPTLNGTHNAGATQLSVLNAGTATNWLRRGDYCQVGQQLMMVTQDVNSSGGAATIPIWPELHSDFAGGSAVDITSPQGDFFLVDVQGLGAVPGRATPNWLAERVVVRLEEDTRA